MAGEEVHSSQDSRVNQELLGLRRRLALLTGLVVADTAILIVLTILTSLR
jgi:hypothetical protein